MSLIHEGWTIGIEGFMDVGTPDDLCVSLSERYLKKNKPKKLTLIHSTGAGDAGTRGINRIALEGMFKRVISCHFSLGMPTITH